MEPYNEHQLRTNTKWIEHQAWTWNVRDVDREDWIAMTMISVVNPMVG